MFSQFNSFIHKNNLYGVHHRLLVTVSGGVDSVVLTDLVSRSGFRWAIAHCNFGLRGAESDGDEQFVRQLAARFQVTCHTRRFNTEEYAREKKISIQMAARELRYAWFEETRLQNGYDVIATAHHRDDVVETVLINLVRGTGFKGLQGIRPMHGKLVRPLLFASREEIEKYAATRKLDFRIDSSNNETKYVRNRIRLELLPMLRSLNPAFDDAVLELAAQNARIGAFWDEEVARVKTILTSGTGDQMTIDIPGLLEHPDPQDMLWELIRSFGFYSGQAADIHASLTAAPGKCFFSATHQLLKDREKLIIAPLSHITKPNETSGNSSSSSLLSDSSRPVSPTIAPYEGAAQFFNTEPGITGLPFTLSFRVINRTKSFLIPTGPEIGCFDHDKLKFPLTVRKWKKGDHFFPLGMQKPKKLSDFFVDQKISRIDKENVWLLLSGQDIIWIIGHRIDHRYRITGKTKKVLMVTATC